jgi:hypothetical protein
MVATRKLNMTVESLILNIPLIIDITIVAAYIIGFSASIFGTYDILHLKWTGDLTAMITALLSCTGILVVCTMLKGGSYVSNAMLISYFFVAVSFVFFRQFSNYKLSHGAKPCKQHK